MATDRRLAGAIAAWWPALALALAAIWVVQPMHDVAWWTSHEAIWYPVRLHEYLASWADGGWYPRWCPNLYGGYGYPFLNYYAPGVYFGGAAIAQLGGQNELEALKLLVTLATMAGAVGAYGLARRETGRSDAALLGAACYAFLPYRCTDLFARGDLAEYCAFCLVPFVAWAYRALEGSTGRRAAWAGCAAALCHAGVLMTHTLIGMFTTELVGLYIVVLLVRRQRRAAIVAAAALMLAIALAAVYVIPAFFERSLVDLARITGDRYRPWLNAVPLTGLGDAFFTPGWPFFAGLAALLASLVAARGRRAAAAAAVPWAIAAAMIAVMLPQLVAIWKLLPFGAEAQFPWRLLGFVGLFTALGLAIWWARLIPPGRGALAAAVVLAAALPLSLSAQRQVAAAPPVPLTDEQVRAAFASTTVMDEYLPRAVVNAPTAPRTREAWSDDPAVHVAGEQRGELTHEIEFDTPHKAQVTVSLFGYRGWKLETLSGPAKAHLGIGKGDGLIRISVPVAGHYKVRVHFAGTWLRTAAALISLLALLALYPVMRWLGHARQGRQGRSIS